MSKIGIASDKNRLPGELTVNIADNVTDAIVLIDAQCRIVMMNPRAEKTLSVISSNAKQQPLTSLFINNHLTVFNDTVEFVFRHGCAKRVEVAAGPERLLLSMNVFPANDETLGVAFHECSLPRCLEMVADSQQQALSMALQNKSQQDILQPLVSALEKQAPHSLFAAVSLIDEENDHISTVTSSIMPNSMKTLLTGKLSDSASPYRTSCHQRDAIVIEDISTAQDWRHFTTMAKECGFNAFWCLPVLSQETSSVIGMISGFYVFRGLPAKSDWQVAERLSHTVAILHKHSCDSRARIKEEDAISENTETLRKQRRLYEAVLSNNPDPIYTFDLSGRFTYVNDALLNIWGITWDEAIGKTCYDLGYEKWHADLHMREIRQVIETKKPIRSDVAYHGTNGTRMYDYIFVPVLDADGNVEAIAGSTRDVTERYEAENMAKEAEARRRIALEASHSFGIWDWDIKNNVFAADQRLGELFNLSAEETAFGVPVERLIGYVHPQDIPVVEATIRESITSGKPYDQQFRILQKDGSVRWGSFRGRVIYDDEGKAERFPGVGVDITREQNAIYALQDADKRKDEFLATLAHELRNPLAPIRNALEILQSGLFSNEKKQESFVLVERQVAQMVRLVDDLMDVSRITRGKIRLSRTPLDICDAIRDAIETVQPLIDESHHKLTVRYPGCEAWVDGDLVRLAQIFSNIINNAAKYTPRGGQIEVSVHANSTSVIVDIADNGVGIPNDKLNDIFDMFSQIEGVLERSQGGLGIGLTLVKRLVELHDGAISVKSDGVGEGTRFSVTFPRVKAGKRPHHKTALFDESDPAMADSSLSVLIADDNQDAAITMGWILEAKGCDVVVVEDGPAALEAVTQFTPDLVLLDIGMPGMNGYDLCVALRKMPALQQAIFVAQTGWGQPSHIQRSKDSGFHHHLVKPLDLSDLMPIVESVRQVKARHVIP